MGKTEFARVIISKLSDAIGTDGTIFTTDTAASAMQAVAEGITDYIIANTTVIISYQGTIPGPPSITDPLVVDTFSLTGTCAATGPSNGFDSWIKQIEANIISGFFLEKTGENGVAFIAPQAAFVKSEPGILIKGETLKAKHDPADKNPQLKIWEAICDGIIQWINSSAANMTLASAGNTKTSSVGTGAITEVILS